MIIIKKIYKIIKRTVIICTLILALAVGSVFSINYYIENTGKGHMTNIDEMPEVDAVVIPGALVYGTQPSLVLQYRLDTGLEIYKSGKAKKIIVTGDHGNKNYDEVNAMKRFLLEHNVPSQDIFMDHAGFDTYQSLYRARDVFLAQKIAIATQITHNIRALYIGKKLGLEVYGIEAPDDSLNAQIQNLREKAARVKAFLEAEIFKPKPKFLGDVIPVWGDGALTND